MTPDAAPAMQVARDKLQQASKQLANALSQKETSRDDQAKGTPTKPSAQGETKISESETAIDKSPSAGFAISVKYYKWR